MKHLPLLTVFAASFVLPAAPLRAGEEPQHPAKPMLWKVEGGKLAKPSYLFGTIHLGYGPLAKLHPAVAQAIDGADAIYTELPMDAEEDKNADILEEMVALYAAGEAEKIDALMEREIKKMAQGDLKELGQRLVGKLIDERDANMAKTILKQLGERSDKVHFFAVGTGHYIGKTSIISHLEKAGYKITRVDS